MEAAPREAVCLRIEPGPKGEKWVCIETRHFRRTMPLADFVARVTDRLRNELPLPDRLDPNVRSFLVRAGSDAPRP